MIQKFMYSIQYSLHCRTFFFFTGKARIKLLTFLWAVLLFSSSSCVTVKIYAPDTASKDRPENPKTDFFQIRSEVSDKMVYYSPVWFTSLFYSKEYENEYGNAEKLISEELRRNSHLYSRSRLNISVLKFSFKNTDSCSFSRSEADVEISVKDSSGAELLNYKNTESVKTYISDCSNVLYTLSIFGMLWYVPYFAGKGTRQDQLDYLGRKSLLEFFTQLKEKLNNEK